MYSPGEVSKLLAVPASTLRRWAVQFAALLSDSAQGQGRKRTYTGGDLDTLARVRDLAAHGIALEDIPAHIGQVIDQPSADQDQTTALALPGVLKEFRRISGILEQMQADQQTTREELARAQKRLDELQEWLQTPWYKRIGKRPPE